jgi:hypothetical protein
MRFHRAAFAAVAAALAAPLSAQQVWTVGAAPGPGIDFTQISAAVAAAGEGDLILVVSGGGFEPFEIDGRSLSVVAPNSAAVVSPGAGGSAAPLVAVRNLAAQQRVVLDGLNLLQFGALPRGAMELENCAGAVWLQSCFVDSYGVAALDLRQSSAVVAVDCFFQTNHTAAGPGGSFDPAPGARLSQASALWAYQSTFRGSHGLLAGSVSGALQGPLHGGAGLRLEGSAARLFGGRAEGGGGTTATVGTCPTGAAGGPGLHLLGGGGPSAAQAFGTSLQGGQAAAGNACSPTFAAGPPALVVAGDLEQQPAAERSTSLSPVLVPGSPGALHFQGPPGDLAILWVSPQASAPLPLAGLDVHLALAPAQPLWQVLLGPTGQWQVPLTVTSAPPTLVQLVTQGVWIDASLGLHASGPAAVSIVP